MSGYQQNGNWHNANGGGLPFRPPTVDEALPYSPFTSIVPFSPDIIPFPTNEPPTPPTILSTEQQTAAKRAIDLLNNEIRGSPNGSQRLQQTFHELQSLLYPNELPQYNFKSITQLATPPPDSPALPQTNGSAAMAPSLSPFANMLLQQTNVDFVQLDAKSLKRPQQNRAQTTVSRPVPPTTPNTSIAPFNGIQSAQSASIGPSSQGGSSSQRKVVIKQSSIRRDEFQRYDAPKSDKQKEGAYNATPTVKSRKQEEVDRRLEELDSIVERFVEEKEHDQSRAFETVETDTGPVEVLRAKAREDLQDAVSKLVGQGYFSHFATERVLVIQSLCEPSIASTGQLSFDLTLCGDDEISGLLLQAHSALRACRLVLQTMTEGGDDPRICPDDRVRGIVGLLKSIMTSSVIPVVEARRAGPSSELFEKATRHKKEITSLLRICGSLFSYTSALIGKVKLNEITLSPIESMSIDTIFTENSDKDIDSVLGIKTFESFRQKGMDVLAQIAAFHPEQRDSIVSEVLGNLERLPHKRTSARQFKSARDEPIMLVTALFLRIAQAAGSCSSKRIETAQETTESNSEDDSDDDESDDETPHARKKKHRSGSSPDQIVTRIWDEFSRVTTQITLILVRRAENVSKSGDKPFRNILDLFIEDLCNVLGSPEWPAASIFLEHLLRHMIGLYMEEKTGQATDMAIATMGSMGCGIIDLQHRLKRARRDIDISQSESAARLLPLVEQALSEDINPVDVFAVKGPYQVVHNSLPTYLSPQGSQMDWRDPYLRSLSGFYITAWANAYYTKYPPDTDKPRHQTISDLERYLKNMISDTNWSEKELEFRDAKDIESQLAAGVIALQGAFCKYLKNIVRRLINITSNNTSSNIVSRAMSSLTLMIEKDSQIVDDLTFRQLVQCMDNKSPKVRDNTLSLVATCLNQDASLEKYCFKGIIQRLADPANGPKKRAIKLLKDIYMKTGSKEQKLEIATNLLLPAQDDDKPIVELAHQTLWELWLQPLRPAPGMDDNRLKLARQKIVSLLVDIVQNIKDPQYTSSFEAFFASVLAKTCKDASQNFASCKDLVADMIDGVISAAASSQARFLQTLGIFARVEPGLFTTDQIQLHLKPYVKNLADKEKNPTNEDVTLFRYTAVIFRYVLPTLPMLQETFLEDIRSPLLSAVTRFASRAVHEALYKDILLDVAHCIWTISPLIKGDPSRNAKNGFEKLMAFVSSLVIQLVSFSASKQDSMSEDEARKTMSYIVILGVFGKVCDLDGNVDTFNTALQAKLPRLVASKKGDPSQVERLTKWPRKSVAVLLLDLLLPYTRQTFNTDFRRLALCAIGEICQLNTKHFTRTDIAKAFSLPFHNNDAILIRVVLRQFRDFLTVAERRSETGAEIAVGDGAVHGSERLVTSFSASDNDHATTHIARTFLKQLVDTALGDVNDLAFFATETLVSISRQGLLHPKECGTALVALSTSPQTAIAHLAAKEQERNHLQHETIFEKEYVAAVEKAFEYHRDVVKDSHGAIWPSLKPKMSFMFSTFKKGSRKTLKLFITNIFKQLQFDFQQLDCRPDGTFNVPKVTLFTRFVLENFAFFEYDHVDEVFHVISNIQDIVLRQIGPGVALAIETELSEQHVEQPSYMPMVEGVAVEVVASEPIPPTAGNPGISEDRLRHLTVASMLLHMMWETRSFLRRAYNLQKKLTAQDIKSRATRNNLIKAEGLWDTIATIMAALDTPESMKKECFELAEIIHVDKEHSVPDEEEDEQEKLARLAAGYVTPDEGERGDASQPTSGRGRKRKSSASVGGTTPKKPRGRPKGSTNKKGRKSTTPEDSD